MFEKSRQEFERAKKLIPGGVNSPVRAFKAVGGEPIFIERGEGAYLYDVDGNRYVDFIGAWGPSILGHAHPRVVEKVSGILRKGFSFGLPTPIESLLAEKIMEFFPSIEKIRLVNSGTEATMTAIRLARGYTERDKIVKFEGCYHGHADCLLVKAGSGGETFGIPTSAGVPYDFAKHTITLPYNDLESLKDVFNKIGNEIAAVIVEPIAGNMGVIIPEREFIENLRELTARHGTILIFDEVMTGFRVHPGGAQALFGVKPDLTCLGKIIGGGMPVGAFGGKAEIMDLLAPQGPVYQAGTLSGNPITVAAGLATLEIYKQEKVFEKLEELGKLLDEAFLTQKQIKYYRAGGMFSIFFTDAPVKNLEDVRKCDLEKFARYHKFMLQKGFLLPPSQFEAAFISAAHTKKDIMNFIEATEEFLLRN